MCNRQALIPPLVSSLVFSLLWNLWTTVRRFEHRQPVSHRCVLACDGSSEGSIERYARRGAVSMVASRYLRLGSPDSIDLQCVMLANSGSGSDDDIACMATLIYGTYMATNDYRQIGYKLAALLSWRWPLTRFVNTAGPLLHCTAHSARCWITVGIPRWMTVGPKRERVNGLHLSGVLIRSQGLCQPRCSP